MTQGAQLILVDGSSFLFRAFHAMPGLSNPEGHPTGAIRGVVSMLRKLCADYPESAIAVVFDPKGETFRNEIFPEYKANRPPMDEELRCQIAPIHEIVRAMGLPLLVVSNFEADDVIGTLAHQASQASMPTLIATSDKDMAQLVNEHVSLYDSMSDRETDVEGVIKKWGVRPNQIVDLLALAGDTSDNIPGVPRVGPKTAAKWLKLYGTVEGVMANAGSIKGVVGQSLREHLDQIPMARRLTAIKLDVELEVTATELERSPEDVEQLEALFTKWSFKTLLAELREQRGSEEATTLPELEVSYRTVKSSLELEALRSEVLASRCMAIHLEWISCLGGPSAIGIAIAAVPGQGAYIPIQAANESISTLDPREPALPLDQVVQGLKPIFEDESIAKVGWELKQLWKLVQGAGISLKGQCRDVQLLSYLNDNLSRGGHTTEALAQRHLDWTLTERVELVGTGKHQRQFREVSLEQASNYCCQRADANLRIAEELERRLAGSRALELCDEVDFPLSLALGRMEMNGVCMDSRQLAELSTRLEQRMREIEREAYALAGGKPFNLGSPMQLAKILYDDLGLTAPRQSRTGHRSTAEAVIEKLATEHPLPGVILDYRKLAVLKATYTDSLLEKVDSQSGRVYTHYNQVVATSSRVASHDPNLQSIPNRTEDGLSIRRAFVAPPGFQILAADYSQIELRVMAHASADEALIRAFRQRQDIHQATAAEIFDKPLEQVSAEERQRAKAINFGLIYGMSAFGLSERLGISRARASHYHRRYFERYPGVGNFMASTKDSARTLGYVETLLGRRLFVANVRSPAPAQRAAAERTAINAPIQGGAADIIKLATVAMDRELESVGLNARMIMQVHDELVFEVAEDAVDRLAILAEEVLSNAIELLIPLEVHVAHGLNWEVAH